MPRPDNLSKLVVCPLCGATTGKPVSALKKKEVARCSTCRRPPGEREMYAARLMVLEARAAAGKPLWGDEPESN